MLVEAFVVAGCPVAALVGWKVEGWYVERRASARPRATPHANARARARRLGRPGTRATGKVARVTR